MVWNREEMLLHSGDAFPAPGHSHSVRVRSTDRPLLSSSSPTRASRPAPPTAHAPWTTSGRFPAAVLALGPGGRSLGWRWLNLTIFPTDPGLPFKTLPRVSLVCLSSAAVGFRRLVTETVRS